MALKTLSIPKNVNALILLKSIETQLLGLIIRYPDGAGLYLKVGKNLSASWVVRYSVDKREHEAGVGSYPAITLSKSRQRAEELRLDAKRGLTHFERRKQEQQETFKRQESKKCTFEKCASSYIEMKKVEWTNPKHVQQWGNTLKKYVFPHIGEYLVKDISTPEFHKVLQPIWNTKTETASRVRQRIEAIFDWAIAQGLRDDRFNPAVWKGNLQSILPSSTKIIKVKHHTALHYSEMPSLFQEIMSRNSTSSRALALAILTVSRTKSILHAAKDQLDLEHAIWTIPADLMKTKEAFRIPLSSGALDIINKSLSEYSQLLFPSPRSFIKPMGSDSIRLHLHQRYAKDLITNGNNQDLATVHGFRSSFRDWAAEMTNHPRDMIEKIMAHALQNQVEAAYQRGDILERRRIIMQEWSDYCHGRQA